MTIDELVRNSRFTILLGKNGSGKSTQLRALDASNKFGTNYISPERGGTLKYDASIEQNITNNDKWLVNDRRKNRTEHFRQQSAYQFRNLEILVLREIEQQSDKRKDLTYSFNNTLSKINALLPAIELKRSDRGFKIYNRAGTAIDENQVSSGEAELIALSIEVLVFARETKTNKVLLLDEPDVHLHPDLQQKFVAFIEGVAVEFDFKVVIATHSTAIIGAFSKAADLQIVPITDRSQSSFGTFRYSPICHQILPVFGAHPLSTQFNKSPVLLVEGEDDKRVFDQLVRSAGGRFSFSPCVVGSVHDMNEWEKWLNEFLPSIYDGPQAFSLRDLDGAEQAAIEDVGCVSRARLNCYAVENFLVTNECLKAHGHDAESFKKSIIQWTDQRPGHPASPALTILASNFDDRRTLKIKEVRNVLLALLGTQKPWEVVVGQLLAANIGSADASKHSVREYLGEGVLGKVFS
ncbi:hypothetical protein FACS189475_07450 [Betaproteobacteria bacterium]|nr:hypothetical protein FACS189475_07450 [Betaproteobacteria bacterium]